MPWRRSIRRELQVAFSLRAQPIWFRVVKWVAAAGVIVVLWRTPHFWWWMFGGAAMALSVHFFWRWKTKAWTQAWGGWDDVEAAGKD